MWMNDGGRPLQTVESSPVSVGYLKMDGHLEAIGAQLWELDTRSIDMHMHTAVEIHFKCTHKC